MKKNFVLLLSILPTIMFGQLVTSIDKDSILIGDHITLSIQADQLDSNSTWPTFNDSIGELEIVEVLKIDSSETENGWTLSQKFTITSWDSGYFKIDPFQVNGNKSDVFYVYVNTITFTEEDTELKDIKEPIKTPVSFAEILPYLLAVLVLALVVYLIKKYLKNRETKVEEIKEVVVNIPPFQIALTELEKLNAKKLWQNGSTKEYHTNVSEIVRTYIENGLHTPAMEMSKADILHRLTQRGIGTVSLDALLSTTDLVTFAKLIPTEIENENCMKIAFTFIQDTKPKEEVNHG